VRLFATCLAELFWPEVYEKTRQLLERLGYQVDQPRGRVCCGQVAYNAGRVAEARRMARRWVEAFLNDANVDYIVAPSASCVAMVRERFPELLPETRNQVHRVLELSEFLHDVVGVDRLTGRFPYRVQIHYSCHYLRGLRRHDELRRILERLEGITVLPTPYEEVCCGFGGVFSLVMPELSLAMAERKVNLSFGGDVEVITSPDPGCLLNLRGVLQRQRRPVRVMHFVEMLVP